MTPRDNALLDAFATGRLRKQIAADFGISVERLNYIVRTARLAGDPRAALRWGRGTTPKREAVRQMLAQGMSVGDIAAARCVTSQAVSNLIARAGLRP